MGETAGEMYALATVLSLLAIMAVGLRFYSRRIKKASIEGDDYLIIAALVCKPGRMHDWMLSHRPGHNTRHGHLHVYRNSCWSSGSAYTDQPSQWNALTQSLHDRVLQSRWLISFHFWAWLIVVSDTLCLSADPDIDFWIDQDRRPVVLQTVGLFQILYSRQ